MTGMGGMGTKEILSRNLRRLIERSGWSYKEVARRAGPGISDKTISNIIEQVHDPKTDKISQVAKVFGLEAYHLLMPDFEPDALKSGSFDRLYHTYIETDDAGRQVLETTADYVAAHESDSENDPNTPRDGHADLGS